MKLLSKLTSFGFLLCFLFGLTPLSHAQSVLEDIKGRLEEEGVNVVDYSTPQGAWGNLPLEWSDHLSSAYEDISALAEEYKNEFIGEDSIADLRNQIAILDAKRSRLSNQEEIADAEEEAELLEEELEDLEVTIKDGIRNMIADAKNLDTEDGINLIFAEIDFYYNYSKWGRLPSRIVGVLTINTQYESLEDMVLINFLDSPDSGEREQGLENLTEELSLIEDLSSDDVELIVNSTIILASPGESQVNQIARAIANTIKNLIAGLAVIWIIISAIRMVFASGDESVITEQKRSITYAIIGLIAILLIDRAIEVLYGAPGEIRTELTPDQGFSNELYGLVSFIKSLVGSVAIMLIIVSGIKMLFASGEEDQITQQKKSLLWIAVGLILVAINKVIVENVFIIPTQQSDQIRTSNVTSLINTVSSVFTFLLGFVGLIAFALLVYGGATMIMNYGNDEMVEKSKKIIRNAIVGILIILSAYVIVASLVVFR